MAKDEEKKSKKRKGEKEGEKEPKKKKQKKEKSEKKEKKAKRSKTEKKSTESEKEGLKEPSPTIPANIAAIAKPTADEELAKKIFKLLKEGAEKKSIRKGIKDVTKAIRRGVKGLCFFACDISPIDVISHLPVLCEDQDVQYIFVSTRESLGLACQTKRPTACVLVTLDESYKTLFQEIKKQIAAQPQP